MDNLTHRATLLASRFMLRINSFLSFIQRFGFFAFMLAAMLLAGDQFPFSNFPMYSILPDSLMSMRLTDAQGNLLPSVPAFGVGTTIIKKQMARELHEMKEKGQIKLIKTVPLDASKEAGQRVLAWVLDNHPPRNPELAGATIKLEQTIYTTQKGSVT